MPTPVKPSIEQIFREMTQIDDAIRAGARDAVRMHQRLGNPIAVWRDGQAIDVPADEIVLPDERPSDQSQPRREAV